jgi:hypothetical protein
LLTGVLQNEDHFFENDAATFETEKINVTQVDPRNKKRLSATNLVLPDSKKPARRTVGCSIQEPVQFEDYIGNFACFDREWYRSDVRVNNDGRADQIYCFCLIDVYGKKEQLHINQFYGDRNAFMNAILDVMDRYPLLIGYWIFGVIEY